MINKAEITLRFRWNDAFKALLSRCSDDSLDRLRVEFEAYPVYGRFVIIKHHDRHLYAVLKPTRLENVKRINNVFFALPRKICLMIIDDLEKQNRVKS